MATEEGAQRFGAWIRKQYALNGVFDDNSILKELGLPSNTLQYWVDGTQSVTAARVLQIAEKGNFNKLDLMVAVGWLTPEEANSGTSPDFEV